MENYYKLCLKIVVIFLYFVNTQRTKLATRFTEFGINSETGIAILHSWSITKSNIDHTLNFVLEMKEDENIDKLTILINQCKLKEDHCSDAMIMNFTNARNLQYFVNAKGFPWSPAFANIRPPIRFPYYKKGFYIGKDVSIDNQKMRELYPTNINNIIFLIKCHLFNKKSEKVMIVNMGMQIVEYLWKN